MASPSNEFPNLSLIREGINFRFPVSLRKLTLQLRPLSTAEEDRISQEVIDELKKLPEENRTGLKQSAKLSIKKLAAAQTPDIHSKEIKMHEAELQMMTPGELQFLFKEYVAACDKVNPSLDSFSREEIIGWVNALKKSTESLETILIESSFYQLAALCRHLLTTPESPEDSSPGLPSTL